MYTMPWILWAWLGCLRVNDDQFLVQDDRKFDAPETVAPLFQTQGDQQEQ